MQRAVEAARAVAALVAVLTVAACGTQVEGDLPITVGPTAPTEAAAPTDAAAPTGPATDTDTVTHTDTPSVTRTDAPRAGERALPTATPPAAAGATSGPSASSGEPSPPAEGPAGTAEATGGPAEHDSGGPSGTARSTGRTTGAGGTGGTSGTGSGPGPTTTAPEQVSTGQLPGFAAPTELLARDAAGAVHLLLDDVRLGVHDGYDRVVLDLSGAGEVGWRAEYVANPSLDGSGIPVDLAGPGVLVVSAQGMAYPEPGDPRYDGGLRLVDGGDLQVVTEVLLDTPFEGQLQVYVGVEAEQPFRVVRLSGPERLVIDIQH